MEKNKEILNMPIQTDYPVAALEVLLSADCLPERYHPLLRQKQCLIAHLRALGCRTKSEAEHLPDAALTEIGEAGWIVLFRRFLALYDPNPIKFRELEKLTVSPEEQAVFRELYHLPGVKTTRAQLYAASGYRSLRDFTKTTVDEVRAQTALTIAANHMSCTVPLPKEIRTHIAVARAFLWDETAPCDESR